MNKKAHIWRLENLIYVRNNLTEYDQVCTVCDKLVHVSTVPEVDYCPGKPEEHGIIEEVRCTPLSAAPASGQELSPDI